MRLGHKVIRVAYQMPYEDGTAMMTTDGIYIQHGWHLQRKDDGKCFKLIDDRLFETSAPYNLMFDPSERPMIVRLEYNDCSKGIFVWAGEWRVIRLHQGYHVKKPLTERQRDTWRRVVWRSLTNRGIISAKFHEFYIETYLYD